MNNQITILNELEAIAPALANAIIGLPYQVPDEYFQNFTANVLSKLSNNDFAKDQDYLLSFVKDLPAKTPYLAPKGYFENLENNILTAVKIEEEENIINFFINSLPKNNAFKAPIGYFNTFANNLINKIALSKNIGVESYSKTTPYKTPDQYFNNLASNILKNALLLESNMELSIVDFPKTMPYQVPTGYFNNLSNTILDSLKQSNKGVPQGYFNSLSAVLLQKVKQSDVENELLAIAPLLNTISKHNILEVPTGYFGNLKPYTPQETDISEKQDTKVISIKLNNSHWLRNAIAACLIGSLGFTAYKLLDQPTSVNEVVTRNSQPEILLANIDIDKELSKLDDTTIAIYLDNDTFTESTAADFQEVKDDTLDQVLQKIPAVDLKQHLGEIEDPNKKRK